MNNDSLKCIIGTNIARYRNEKGLTQAELAERVGITTAFVSRVERGQKMLKVETLSIIAHELQVSCDALLRQESNETHIENIKILLACQPEEYLPGLEKLIRTCVEEFQPKEENFSNL